jgi:hypothetical protein
VTLTFHGPVALSKVKELRYPFDRRLSGSQGSVRTIWYVKILDITTKQNSHHTQVTNFCIIDKRRFQFTVENYIFSIINGSTVHCWASAAFSVSWSHRESVGLVGREISPTQGFYLHTVQHKHRINARRHLCFEWIWIHDINIWEGRNSLCLWPLGHCDGP